MKKQSFDGNTTESRAITFPNNKGQKTKWICYAYAACNKSVIHFIHRSIILSVQYTTETSQEEEETSKKPKSSN